METTPLNNLAVYLTVNKMTSPLIGLASCTPLWIYSNITVMYDILIEHSQVTSCATAKKLN